MTRTCMTILNNLRHVWLALALALLGTGTVAARDYHGGGGWHHHPSPSPAPASSSSGSTSSRTYSSYYRSGGSSYGFQNFSGQNSYNGYNGNSVSINTPHRGDWEAKLQAQRQWDNMQYQKMQREDASNVRCGLSNPPAYCYRLQGPYPTEMRVVRY